LKARFWQQRLAKKTQRELMSLLRSQSDDLRKIIAKAARQANRIMLRLPGDSVSEVTRRAFYAQRRLELIRLAADTWEDKIPASIMRDIGEATKLANKTNRQLLRVLLEAVPDDSLVLARSFLRSAEDAFLDLQSRMLNNVRLSASVYRNEALMMGKIDDVVNNGILLGQSSKEIAEGVVQYINPDVMGGQRHAANRLARTELNNAFHRTSIESYKASPYVIGVQWNLSGSHDRDDECDDWDGEVFPKDEVPDKPHPQCYCFLTPISPEPDEFAEKLLGGDYDGSLIGSAVV
jgi:hypothetical protein